MSPLIAVAGEHKHTLGVSAPAAADLVSARVLPERRTAGSQALLLPHFAAIYRAAQALFGDKRPDRDGDTGSTSRSRASALWRLKRTQWPPKAIGKGSLTPVGPAKAAQQGEAEDGRDQQGDAQGVSTDATRSLNLEADRTKNKDEEKAARRLSTAFDPGGRLWSAPAVE